MLTVLFVLVVLFAACKLLSALDNQCISSSVSDYLRCEYHMADARRNVTVSGLRNI